MTPVEHLEAEVARDEAALQAELERAVALWRELSTRLRALQAQAAQAEATGLDLKSLAGRVAAIELPTLPHGPAQLRSEQLRRDAVEARREAIAEVKAALPTFTGALARAQYKISAEEGAVAQNVDLARAVAREVAAAARKLEAAGDEPLPIGRIQPKRVQPRVRMQVKIDFTCDGKVYSGFSTNLSDGGLFIATVKGVPIGTHLGLHFELPGGAAVQTNAVVRWVRGVDDRTPGNVPGLGVQFVELGADARQAIIAFVKERE